MLLVSGCAAFIVVAPAARLCLQRARARVAPPAAIDRRGYRRVRGRRMTTWRSSARTLRRSSPSSSSHCDDKIEYAELHSAHLHGGAAATRTRPSRRRHYGGSTRTTSVITRGALSDALVRNSCPCASRPVSGGDTDAFGDGGDISDGGLHADADVVFARPGRGRRARKPSLDVGCARPKTRVADVAVDKIFARLDANLDGVALTRGAAHGCGRVRRRA